MNNSGWKKGRMNWYLGGWIEGWIKGGCANRYMTQEEVCVCPPCVHSHGSCGLRRAGGGGCYCKNQVNVVLKFPACEMGSAFIWLSMWPKKHRHHGNCRVTPTLQEWQQLAVLQTTNQSTNHGPPDSLLCLSCPVLVNMHRRGGPVVATPLTSGRDHRHINVEKAQELLVVSKVKTQHLKLKPQRSQFSEDSAC